MEAEREETHHRQEEPLRVLDLEVFILELLAVDRLATGPVPRGEVATLHHEPSCENNACQTRRVVSNEQHRRTP